MNLRSVDLNLLTVFDAVITEGNITRAADKIGMSQPAMSIAISRFKHIAKDELFERTGRGVRPTPRALALAGPVRRALDIVNDALEQSTEFEVSRSERAFNLALSDYGELALLPSLMELLESHHSRIRINARSILGADIVKEMHYGNIDLYLWLVPPDSDDISSEQIGTMREVLLVSKNHSTVKSRVTLKQYAGLRHIVYSMPGEYGPSLIDRELWRHKLKREHSMTIHSYFDAPRILAQTDLVCSVPEIMARHFARVHDLKIVESPIALQTPVFLMWPRAMDNDPGHRWLRERISEIHAQQ